MLLRWAADENFNHVILRALRHRVPLVDIALVSEVMPRAEDPAVLEWAARESRLLLTHDEQTMVGLAYERIRRGDPMSGLVVVHSDDESGAILDDLQLIAEATTPQEFVNRVEFLPI